MNRNNPLTKKSVGMISWVLVSATLAGGAGLCAGRGARAANRVDFHAAQATLVAPSLAATPALEPTAALPGELMASIVSVRPALGSSAGAGGAHARSSVRSPHPSSGRQARVWTCERRPLDAGTIGTSVEYCHY